MPSAHFWDEGQEAFIKFEMERAGLAHAAFLFGREFATEQELWGFARGLDTVDKVKAALVHPERLLLNAGFEGTFEQKVENYLQQSVLPKRGMTPGLALAINSVGRMGQASDLLAKSRELGGVPMLEAPTSWHYLKWRLEYGADTSASGERLVDEHVLRGLVGAPETDCGWIGKLPDDALIELRTTGALSELRAKLGAGVGEIVDLAPTDYQKSAHRVYGNIDQLLSEHAIALRELRGKKWTFAGTELSSSVVYGAVAFASAIGVPLVSLVNTFIEQTDGTPKIADLAERNRALKEEAANLKNSVVGVMFEARKKAIGD